MRCFEEDIPAGTQVVYTSRVRGICVQGRVVDATYKEEVAEFLTMIVFPVVAGSQAVGQGWHRWEERRPGFYRGNF